MASIRTTPKSNVPGFHALLCVSIDIRSYYLLYPSVLSVNSSAVHDIGVAAHVESLFQSMNGSELEFSSDHRFPSGFVGRPGCRVLLKHLFKVFFESVCLSCFPKRFVQMSTYAYAFP